MLLHVPRQGHDFSSAGANPAENPAAERTEEPPLVERYATFAPSSSAHPLDSALDHAFVERNDACCRLIRWTRFTQQLTEVLVNRDQRLLLVMVVIGLALGAAPPARAQGFVSPLVGMDFGGDAQCPNLAGDMRTRNGWSSR
jgi:hypothetical protein